jgi:hypothetical protein
MSSSLRRGRALFLVLGSLLVMAGLAAPSAGAANSTAQATDVHINAVPGQCKIRITSLATGKFIRHVGSGSGTGLYADSDARGSWEEFWVTDAGNNNLWLQSNGNGNYVGVWQVGQLSAAFPTRNESFARWRWQDINTVDRTFRLYFVPTGNVVRVEPGSNVVRSDNQNRDTWTTFRYDKVLCL